MPESNYREELQLLFDAAESFVEPALGHHRPWAKAMDRARAALAQPELQEPSDEEIDALVICVQALPVPDADDLALPSIDRGREMVRQALARWGRPAIEPVPMSERLPRPENKTTDDECWFWDPISGCWFLLPGPPLNDHYTHWLPHHALPVPRSEEN